MTSTELANSVRNRGEACAEKAATLFPETFLVGWLSQALEEAYDVLIQSSDPAAKTFLSSLTPKKTTP
jgi:hypothetical protein